MFHPVIARTTGELKAMANPDQVPGQSQADAWYLYDTQLYVSGTTRELTFFGNTGTPDITNMGAAGQLTDPNYFEIWSWHFDVLEPVLVADAGVGEGPWNDVQSVVKTGRPSFRFVMSDKNWGPFPLEVCNGVGGVTGYGYNVAGILAEAREYANNQYGEGFVQDSAIVIPPKVNFAVTIQWPAPLTLQADTFVRFYQSGTLHRRVL